MTAKNYTTLVSEMTAAFGDNTSGDITPAILRAFIQDFLDSVNVGTLQPTFASLVGVQSFTASGTYTPTAGATKAFVILTGGGGHGGSQDDGMGGTTVIAGGSGATVFKYVATVSTETVTIGGSETASSFGATTAAPGVWSAPGSGGANASFSSPGGHGYTGHGGASFWGSGGAVGSAGVAYGSGGGGTTTPAITTAGAPGVCFVLEFAG